MPIYLLHKILEFFGRHSMNIFLIHSFIRGGYMADFTYSFKHFALIVIILFTISLLISIVLEYCKKIIKIDLLVDKICNQIES